MSEVKLEAGFTYEWLTLREPINGGKFWLADCQCGGTTKVSRWHWTRGLRRSCGCRRRTPPKLIVCKQCKLSKPRSEFYMRKNGRLFYTECKRCTIEKQKAASIKRQRQLRLDALHYYSNGILSCACCGEGYLEFLVIDHIDGGGNKHRKAERFSNLYRWLKTNCYPPGFRVLCNNCNFSYGAYGYCPHQPGTSRWSPLIT